jgi:putative spermidine/putrescine transport system permease protein
MILALYLLYLLLPIVLLAVGAFGEVWTNTLLPTGVTLRWFADVWADTSFRRSFSTSLQVAAATCVSCAVLATPLAYALHHKAGSGSALVGRLVAAMPVAVPALTLGFGYILVFSSDTLPWLGSLPLLIAAHVVLTLPYLTQTLLADLRHLGLRELEACAATLGATPWRQFSTVALPALRHSLVTGSVMVVALSIGEFQLSNLVASFKFRTYPVVLLQAFYGATGYACAATVVLLVLALLAAGLSARRTVSSA